VGEIKRAAMEIAHRIGKCFKFVTLRASNGEATALLDHDTAQFVKHPVQTEQEACTNGHRRQLNELERLMIKNAALREYHTGLVGINCVRPSQTVKGEAQLQAVKNCRNYRRKVIMATDAGWK
jgi:hypothetical protein